jgi:addiction module RelE/StbE family toxin
MEYKVKLTEEFIEDFEEICEYISNELKNIDASNRLREKVIYNILLLENSPKMFTEIEKIDKTERKYRRMIVNNYIILYTIEESKKVVYIAHIYYGARNYMDDLM